MTPHPTSPDGVATAAPTEVGPWRTSSYSGNGQNCVEVAPSASGVLLRDTEDRGTGPALAFTSAQWTAFLAESRTGATGANGAVEVTHTPTGTDVRGGDTTPHFTPGEWTAFRNGVRDREFDLLAV